MIHRYRLPPLAGFIVNPPDKLFSMSEYSSSEDHLLRIQDADQISGGHSPHLHSLVKNFRGQTVAFMVGVKHVMGSDLIYRSAAQHPGVVAVAAQRPVNLGRDAVA